MLTNDKITGIFCIADDFCKEFEKYPKATKSVEIAPAGRQTAKS